MLIRFIRPPSKRVTGVDTSHYRVGREYDLPASIASMFILDDCAVLVERSRDHANETPPRKRPATRNDK